MGRFLWRCSMVGEGIRFDEPFVWLVGRVPSIEAVLWHDFAVGRSPVDIT